MKSIILSLTIIGGMSNWSFASDEFEPSAGGGTGEVGVEQLLEDAEGAVKRSQELRDEIAQEGGPNQNYREIASEEETSWQQEMDEILAE